jgi:3-methyladenine DNA glycosylase AlkD
MLNLVGEEAPEFITPNANSLVVTAKQMADKMRPQLKQFADEATPQMESIAENMKANAPKIATNRGSKEVDFEMLFNGQSQQVAQTNKLLEQVVRAIKKNGGDLQLV